MPGRTFVRVQRLRPNPADVRSHVIVQRTFATGSATMTTPTRADLYEQRRRAAIEARRGAHYAKAATKRQAIASYVPPNAFDAAREIHRAGKGMLGEILTLAKEMKRQRALGFAASIAAARGAATPQAPVPSGTVDQGGAAGTGGFGGAGVAPENLGTDTGNPEPTWSKYIFLGAALFVAWLVFKR
jgi:hypothetical protein